MIEYMRMNFNFLNCAQLIIVRLIDIDYFPRSLTLIVTVFSGTYFFLTKK